MAKIHIPTPLRQYADKHATVEVNAATVGEALTGLVNQHPELRRHLYTDEGKLRAFVNVYLNDEDIRYLEKEGTALNDNDSISIVPSIAGGSQNIVELSNLRISELNRAFPMRCCPACCCCC
jgi:adenylyltransferase/sulfurtransferase